MSHQLNNLITMGKIVNSFGIQGFVKIKADTQSPDSLTKYQELYLLINNNWTLFKLEKSFVREDVFHGKFFGINDRDQALSLKGVVIGIPRDQFPTLPQDEYYWADLIGLKVYNKENEDLGMVKNLMEAGGNSVLVIKHEESERLIPFVNVYILDVDFVKQQIIVDWGLDY